MSSSSSSSSSSPYIWALFGWEATQATPNRDPYSNSLRVLPGTGQIYTSLVHFKHHWRRGVGAVAPGKIGGEYADKADGLIYYQKENARGESQNVEDRRKVFTDTWGLDPKKDLGRQIARTALDLPLFGYVGASKGEKTMTINGVMPLFFPATFHEAEVLSLGINNAFPTGDSESAGSSIHQVLSYGHFMALIEFDTRQIAVNAEGHRAGLTPDQWVDLALEGLWAAYSTHRTPSVSQRNQFAHFLYKWSPDLRTTPVPQDPASLFSRLGENKLIRNTEEATAALRALLPDYLKSCGAHDITTVHARSGASLI